MRLYTRGGDEGETGLWRSGRVGKDDPRIELIGEVDELNAHLGLARALLPAAGCEELASLLLDWQCDLFELGAEIADGRGEARVTQSMVTRIEQAVDRLANETSPLERFILPGGHPAAAQLHVARTVARRVERRLVALSRRDAINPFSRSFINRLSDALFASARWANARLGHAEPTWPGDAEEE